MFNDVCKYMNDKNFEFINFSEIASWKRSNSDVGKSEIAWADAIFLRPVDYILNKYKSDNEILLKFCLICLAYNLLGLCRIIKENINNNMRNEIDQIYLNVLKNSKNKQPIKKIINKIKQVSHNI